MTTEQAKATITRQTRLIPIIYDADGGSFPVAEPTIAAALKGYDWESEGCLGLGFKFAQAVKATITPADGGEPLTFKRQEELPKTYLFAESAVSAAEFNRDPQYKNAACDAFRKAHAKKLADPANIVYQSGIGLGVLDSYSRESTILITRQGKQLYGPS